MSLDDLKKRYVKCTLAELIFGMIGVAFIWLLCRCAMHFTDFPSIETEVLVPRFLALIVVLMLGRTLYVTIRKLSLVYKSWDVFQVRILNKVNDSQGNLRITLDSPVFAYYTSVDKEEQEHLEAKEQVTIVAYGTKFIALY